MLIFPSMLINAAQEAGIPVPNVDVDTQVWNKELYPQWTILCATQLSRPMNHGEHWENAKALALIDIKELKNMTWNDLAAKGVCPEI